MAALVGGASARAAEPASVVPTSTAATTVGAAPSGVRTATIAARTASTSAAAAPGAAPASRPLLTLSLTVSAELFDHGLPRHPTDHGRSHVGVLLLPVAIWQPHTAVDVTAGARVRIPTTLDLEDEVGALPVLRIDARLLGGTDRTLTLRLGSLEHAHGFHPAVAHEARLAYGRDVAEAYDRPLAAGGRRDLGDDPWMPGEHGAQLVLDTRHLWVDAFLDWQLLETEAHREKFVVGALARLQGPRAELSLQLRLDHYGGEKYTQSDPLRRAGLDPTRQDLVLAAAGRVRPLVVGPLAVDVVAALIGARPLVVEDWRGGVELGADLVGWSAARIGYRWWRTIGPDFPGDLGEAGDPTYRQLETHRVRFALGQALGPLQLESRVDVVFPTGVEAVQYELSTRASIRWDWPIISLSPASAFE